MSSTEKEKTFNEILIMQCYGGEDTFTVKECKKAVREWLEQKLGDFKFNEYDTPLTDNLQGAKEQLQELIGELTV